jgi:4-amino-4-deoxy-L-arabinose transferase-like glycosyltransferase
LDARKLSLIGLVCVLCLYIVSALYVGEARAPWWDEGCFADSAYNLAFHGKFVSTTWHPVFANLPDFPQITKYTYWTMPLYPATLAGWFYLFGFSISSMHMYSLVWGVVLILAIYAFVWSLTEVHPVALASAALTAVDTVFILDATDGRPDVMTAALGFCGLAFYMVLREKRFRPALLVSWLLVTLSALTHPMGSVHIGALAVGILLLDRKRLRLMDFGIMAIPPIIGALGWGLYIIQAPDVFLQQFGKNLSSRSGLSHFRLLSAFSNEIRLRYFNFFVAGPSRLARVRLLAPSAVLTAFSYLLLSGNFLRQRSAKLLVAISVTAFWIMLLVDNGDNSKASTYLIHAFPLYWAMSSVAAYYMLRSRRILGMAFAALLGGVFVMEVGIIAYKSTDYAHKTEFAEMVQTIQQQPIGRDALIMAPSQFMFGLRPDYRLDDDPRLGYYTGMRPEVIIRSVDESVPSSFEEHEPQVARYMADMLENQSEVVFRNHDYTFYRVVPRRK